MTVDEETPGAGTPGDVKHGSCGEHAEFEEIRTLLVGIQSTLECLVSGGVRDHSLRDVLDARF